MKNILLSFLLLSVNLNLVFAQAPDEVVSPEVEILLEGDAEPTDTPASENAQDLERVDPFDVELHVETQSVWTGNVPLLVKFRSNVDAPRTEISWDSPTGLRITPNHPRFVNAVKGEVYTYRATLRPESSGTYNIAVNVTAWQVQTNYTSSASKILSIDDSLKVTPQSPEYATSQLVRSIVIGLLSLGILGGLVYLGRIGFERAKEWLKPPA